MREFASPRECVEAQNFWRAEEALADKAKDVIKKFSKIFPHDIFKIMPASYNLSIQYD
jgi:hypothetical protein